MRRRVDGLPGDCGGTVDNAVVRGDSVSIAFISAEVWVDALWDLERFGKATGSSFLNDPPEAENCS
jgi:hypothetical protein